MKERLDKILLKRNFFTSRERARAFIIGGNVSVNGEKVRKPSQLVPYDAEVTVVLAKSGYVSRGGLKLEGALDEFGVDPRGAFCLDIGASTGGFTDCLLKKEARHVVAIDVGRNQLAYSLRTDPRVTVMEGCNARYIATLEFREWPSLVTIDVSFISITRILVGLLAKINLDTKIIALIKPQFELQKPSKGFRGVVKDGETHRRVLRGVTGFVREAGYALSGLTYSKVLGPKGNIEFFVFLEKGAGGVQDEGIVSQIDSLVERAHAFFTEGRGGRS